MEPADNNEIQKDRFSSVIDLKKLEQESRDLLYLGFFIAVCLHTILAFWFNPGDRFDTVEFYPIELMIRRPVTRQPARQPRTAERQKSLRRDVLPSGKPSGTVDTRRPSPFTLPVPASPESPVFAPMEADEMLDGSPAENRWGFTEKRALPLPSQLFDDTGEYTARVAVDPHDKQAIQGYVRLLYVWDKPWAPPDTLDHPVVHLADALNHYTNISAAPAVSGDPVKGKRLPCYPLVYIDAVDFLNMERPDIVLFSCGFFMIDACKDGYPPQTLRSRVHERLARIIPYFNPQAIHKKHPLYHCYFDFPDRPPSGIHDGAPGYIEGIFSGTSLVGIFCPQGYGTTWSDENNDDRRRFGVNIAVYALAPGKWYDEQRRLTFHDTATHDFTMWHENGRVRFRGTQRGEAEWNSPWHSRFMTGQAGAGDRSWLWLPEHACRANRIVSYTSNCNTPDKPFDPDKLITTFLFNYYAHFQYLSREVSGWDTAFSGQNMVTWGAYNIYEGWHENGQKMYHYNYNDRFFTEWDETGDVLAASGHMKTRNEYMQ